MLKRIAKNLVKVVVLLVVTLAVLAMTAPLGTGLAGLVAFSGMVSWLWVEV